MTVTLPSAGITQVTVTSNAPLTGTTGYDFFIDNVQFTAAASPGITTLASGLNFPFGVAVDATGNVYVADRNNNKVRKFDSSGVEQASVAGTGEAGYNGDGIAATTAQLDSPRGVAWSNGNLFIADSGSHIVRKVILSSGIISTVAGIPQKPGVAVNGGSATLATLFVPTGVATDGAGNLYIADSMNQQIRKVNAADGMIVAVAGVAGVTGNNNGPVSTATLNSPLGVAVNSAGTLVYIADEGNNRIVGVNSDGVFTVVTGLDSPAGVVVAANGTLYIADTDNQRILSVFGESTPTVAGNGSAGFSGDGGPATAAQLNMPVGVAVDSTGRFLYIADLINNRIRKVDFGPPILQ
jgi:DNA-binding beta-propeller fold protein YncE